MLGSDSSPLSRGEIGWGLRKCGGSTETAAAGGAMLARTARRIYRRGGWQAG